MNKAITEIRGQDTAELQAKLSDLRKEKFQLLRLNSLVFS
jgi:ribosomal protein L29